MEGNIIRITNEGIAISIINLDLDSFVHLRNIVKRNALDEQKIIEDFENRRIDKPATD